MTRQPGGRRRGRGARRQAPATPLPGFEAGKRSERTQHRVVVHPDADTPVRWVVNVPDGGDPWATAAGFWVATRVEYRTVVTYTTDWHPTGPTAAASSTGRRTGDP